MKQVRNGIMVPDMIFSSGSFNFLMSALIETHCREVYHITCDTVDAMGVYYKVYMLVYVCVHVYVYIYKHIYISIIYLYYLSKFMLSYIDMCTKV